MKEKKIAKKQKNEVSTKKLVLTIAERIVLSIMFKTVERDSLKGWMIQRNILNKIDLESREIETIGLKETSNGGLTWDPEKAKDLSKEVEFTQTELDNIFEKYKIIGSKPNSLTSIHMSLWDKFGFEFSDE